MSWTLLVRHQRSPEDPWAAPNVTIDAYSFETPLPAYREIGKQRLNEAVTGLWLLGDRGLLLHSWRAPNPLQRYPRREDSE